jgi:hypothetical protein
MALIVGKRRMADIKMGGDVLMSQSTSKRWCSASETTDNRTMITIPTLPVEKLRVVFPDTEDKVSVYFCNNYRLSKKLFNVVIVIQRQRLQSFKKIELMVEQNKSFRKRKRKWALLIRRCSRGDR